MKFYLTFFFLSWCMLLCAQSATNIYDKFELKARKALHCHVVSSSVKGVVVVDQDQITYEVKNGFLQDQNLNLLEIEAAYAVIVNKCGKNKIIVYHDNKGLEDGDDVEFYFNGNRFNPKDPKYRREIARESQQILADRQWAKHALKRQLEDVYEKAIEEAQKVRLAIVTERQKVPPPVIKIPDFNGFMGVSFDLSETEVMSLFLDVEPPLKVRQRIGRKASAHFALTFEGYPSIKSGCVSTLVFTNKKLTEIQLVLDDTPDYSTYTVYEKAFRDTWNVTSPNDNRKTALKKGQSPYFDATNDVCQAHVEVKHIQGGPVELHITIKPRATIGNQLDGIKL